MGGSVTVQATAIAPLDAYGADDKFELVLLATKAHDAIEVAPKLSSLLGPNATLLPIQNGGVPQMLAERLGNCVPVVDTFRTLAFLPPGLELLSD
jgi:2-dehydropantoate 2-reductase